MFQNASTHDPPEWGVQLEYRLVNSVSTKTSENREGRDERRNFDRALPARIPMEAAEVGNLEAKRQRFDRGGQGFVTYKTNMTILNGVWDGGG